MKVYIADEAGAKQRVIRDIVKLDNPKPEGYTYHGMVLFRGGVIVVGSMSQDAPYWCDLNIPMRQARTLLEGE